MTIIKTRNETGLTDTARSRFRATDADPPPAPAVIAASSAAIESLLLGVALRGWLTDSEKEFLDSLSPDRTITFLMRGKRYLHPEDTELFPHHVIESAIQQGGRALFSHRCQRGRSDAACYRILTGGIEHSSEEALILGYFGPEYWMGLPEIQDRFSRLVAQFRSAWDRACQACHALVSRPEWSQPLVVVNRCSGRVVLVNEQAERLLQDTQRALTGREFGDVKSQFTDILCERGVKITNIAGHDFFLAVIALLSPQVSAATDSSLQQHLLGIIHDKSTRLAQLAANLGGEEPANAPAPVEDRLGLVEWLAGDVGRLAGVVGFARSMHRLLPEPIDLLAELESAVAASSLRTSYHHQIRLLSKVTHLEARLIQGGFARLAAAILLSHSGRTNSAACTTVSVNSKPQSTQVSFVFETRARDRELCPVFEDTWSGIASQLAARLGVKLTRTTDQSDRVLTTSVVIEI